MSGIRSFTQSELHRDRDKHAEFFPWTPDPEGSGVQGKKGVGRTDLDGVELSQLPTHPPPTLELEHCHLIYSSELRGTGPPPSWFNFRHTPHRLRRHPPRFAKGDFTLLGEILLSPPSRVGEGGLVVYVRNLNKSPFVERSETRSRSSARSAVIAQWWREPSWRRLASLMPP